MIGDVRKAITNRLRWRQLPFAAAASIIALSSAIALSADTLSDAEFERLKEDVQAQLDTRHKTAQLADELFPGATFAFALSDGRVASFAVGNSDIENHRPMSPSSRMPSGSIGKTYVAAVVLHMVADGLLHLDDRIGNWLGNEAWFDRLPNRNTVTVRQLLNHSSGLIDHVFDTESKFQERFRIHLGADKSAGAMDPRDMVQFVLDREPLFPAGEGFHYSDTNYILLGRIIEKAGGSTYYEELTARFLKPLHLDQTSPLNRRDINRLATGYAPESQALFGLPFKVVKDGVFVFDPSLEWTGGGLVTNSEDLVHWAMALFAGNAIGRKNVSEMVSSIAMPEHFADDPDRQYGYGLGINIARTGAGVAYRHGGFFPGYNSLLAYFPDDGIAVAMQINSDRSNIEEHFDALAEFIIGRAK